MLWLSAHSSPSSFGYGRTRWSLTKRALQLECCEHNKEQQVAVKWLVEIWEANRKQLFESPQSKLIFDKITFQYKTKIRFQSHIYRNLKLQILQCKDKRLAVESKHDAVKRKDSKRKKP